MSSPAAISQTSKQTEIRHTDYRRTRHLALVASPTTQLTGGHDAGGNIVSKHGAVHAATLQAVAVLAGGQREVHVWLTSVGEKNLHVSKTCVNFFNSDNCDLTLMPMPGRS